MITKKKMVERTVRIEKAEVEGRFYKYRLSVRRSTAPSYTPPLYSITVEMTDEKGEKTAASLKEAFSDAETAFVFFNKIFENLATPIDLPYVFADDYN